MSAFTSRIVVEYEDGEPWYLRCTECDEIMPVGGLSVPLEAVIDRASAHIAEHWIHGFADWLERFVGGLRAAVAADRAAQSAPAHQRASRPLSDDLDFEQGSGPESFDCPETMPAPDTEPTTGAPDVQTYPHGDWRNARTPFDPE